VAQASSAGLQAPFGPAIPTTYKARSFVHVGVVSEARKCLGGANRESSYPTSRRVPQTRGYPNLVGALGKKADVWTDKHSATAPARRTDW
jgi:hypothetical protein